MAVPNPERELDRLRQVLQRGLPEILVILGPSAFFRSEAFEIALAAIPADVDLRIVNGEERTDGAELDDLRGASLFAPGSFLCVRRAASWLGSHGDELLELAGKIAPGCGILLETPKLDRRRKLGKQLTKIGEVFELRELYAEPYDRSRSPLEAELVAWVAQRARVRGLRLTPEAAYLLVVIVGKEPAELVAELGRLRTAVGEQHQPLTPELLRGRLHSSFGSTPFELAEAILAGDRRAATRSLEGMLERGARGRDGARIERAGLFPFIASWLYQSFAKVLEGRELLDRGVPAGDVPGRLGVRMFTDRFAAQVAGNPQARLRRGLALLLQCQRDLRRSGEDPRWLLTRFLSEYFTAEVAR